MTTRLGLKFRITEEERMNCLLNKVSGASWLGWCCEEDIKTDDLYEKEPWEVFGNSVEDERYFFTPLKGVGRNEKKSELRVCRNVGKAGSWSNKGQKAPIFGRKGCLIGHKRSFRYQVKKGSNSDSDSNYDWLMKEYTLSDMVKRRVKQKYGVANFALCILKRRRKMNKGCPAAPVVEEEESESVDDVDEWLSQQGFALGASSSSSNLLQAVGGHMEEDDRVPIEDAELPFLRPIEEVEEWRGMEEMDEWPLPQSIEGGSELQLDTSIEGSELQLEKSKEEDGSELLKEKSIEGSELLIDKSTEDECSAQKGGADTEDDFNFGFCLDDFNSAAAAAPSFDHFSCWDDGDLFADYRFPWAPGMLPVSVV